MKYLLMLLMSCAFSLSVLAESVTVKGKLIDSKDKTGLPYATISVFKETTPKNAVKKLATDESGNFSTTLSAGKYIFSFQFVGMNSLRKNVEVVSSSVDLGIVELHEGSTELDELSVVAQKPLVKVEIDKLTYSAKDDPEATTSSVLDLLRKVPMVTVDGEENIQLKGSSSFKVYLNGKPSNMISANPSQVLKSMPANSIKDIEVITDPGAKYDAEGVGGIINIVTDKRVDDGYSGFIGGNGDTFGGYGGNAYLSLKYGKFGFTGNGAYFYHNRPAGELTLSREETKPTSTQLTKNGSQKSNGGGLFYNTSLNYELDTLNLFNVSVGKFGGTFRSESEHNAVSRGAWEYAYLLTSKSRNHFGNFNLSADYQ